MKVRLITTNSNAVIPEYAHKTDSGLDLIAIEEMIIPAGKTGLISTGIAIELPPNTEAQIRPRSGLALSHQITVLNTPGTVDEGYRGEIKIILINHGKNSFTVTKGMKIAQMVIAPVLRPEIEKVEQLTQSDRAQNGFGSTGI